MIYSVDVRIETPVNDTEVTERVADAVQNVFPDAEPAHEDGQLVATTHTLDAFSDVLYDQEILDTARRVFTQNATESGFSFDLKKQAAFEGIVNFAVGEPDALGDIHVDVQVREPDVDSFIDYVAPATDEGQPVDPVRTYGERPDPEAGER